MKSIVLKECGNFQSFSVKNTRGKLCKETFQFPTKSQIIGQILCGLGCGYRDEEETNKTNEVLEKLLTGIKYIYVYSMNTFSTQTDYQTVGQKYLKNDPYEDNFIAKTWEIDKKGVLKSDKSTSDKGLYSNAVIFHKEYIINPCYYIKLEVEDELEEEIIKAFTKPVWQIFLGRKNCIPCEQIYKKEYETELELVLDERKCKQICTDDRKCKQICTDREIDNYDTNFFLFDVPTKWGRVKEYSQREVFIKYF